MFPLEPKPQVKAIVDGPVPGTFAVELAVSKGSGPVTWIVEPLEKGAPKPWAQIYPYKVVVFGAAKVTAVDSDDFDGEPVFIPADPEEVRRMISPAKANKEQAAQGTNLLFVYGSLRKNMYNHPMIERFKLPFAGEGRVKGVLVDLGAYPALLADTSGRTVTGELYHRRPMPLGTSWSTWTISRVPVTSVSPSPYPLPKEKSRPGYTTGATHPK